MYNAPLMETTDSTHSIRPLVGAGLTAVGIFSGITALLAPKIPLLKDLSPKALSALRIGLGTTGCLTSCVGLAIILAGKADEPESDSAAVHPDVALAELLTAMSREDLEGMDAALARGADVNGKQSVYSPPGIVYAVRSGRVKAVQWFVTHGANLEWRDSHGRTPLIEAACKGKLDCAESLLKGGADHSAKDKRGRSFLDCVKPEHRERAEQLLATYRSSHSEEPSSSTSAASSNSSEMAQPVKTDEDKASPHSTQELDVGGNEPKNQSPASSTGPDADLGEPSPSATDALSNPPETAQPVEKIEDKPSPQGSDPTDSSSEPEEVEPPSAPTTSHKPKEKPVNSDLHAALASGSLKQARLLIESGTDVNAPDEDGNAPIFAVSKSQDEELLTLLLEKGANPNAVNAQGASALALASESQKKVLIYRGADAKAYVRNHTSLTHRFEIKHEFRDKELIQLLEEAWDAGDGEAGLKRLRKKFNDAIRYPHLDKAPGTVRRLTKLKLVDPNQLIDGNSPLLSVVLSGEVMDGNAVIRALLDAGVDVNIPNAFGYTPLLFAIKRGDKQLTRDLLDHGANPNQRMGMSGTPLQVAANNEALFKLLLEYRADSKSTLENMIATYARGRTEEEAERTLKIVIGGMKACSFAKQTFLKALPESLYPQIAGLKQAVSGGNPTAVQKLLGAHTFGQSVLTPLLFQAIASRHTDVAIALVNAGANLNAKNKSGALPLHEALRIPDKALVEAMIQRKKACVNYTERKEGTPVVPLQVVEGNEPLFKLLLKRGAGPKAYLYRSKMPREQIRLKFKDPELVKTLEGAWATMTKTFKHRVSPEAQPVPLHQVGDTYLTVVSKEIEEAVTEGKMDQLTKLIEGGSIDPNGWCSDHQLPLLHACFMAKKNHLEVLSAILKIPDVNVEQTDEDGETALHCAVWGPTEEAVRQLLEKGAKVHGGFAVCGVTPLHEALGQKNWKAAYLLIKAGSDLTLSSKKSRPVNALLLDLEGADLRAFCKAIPSKAEISTLFKDEGPVKKLEQAYDGAHEEQAPELSQR